MSKRHPRIEPRRSRRPRPCLERVEERFDITPSRLIGDTAYGAAPMLGWIVAEKKLQPHIPVWDKSERDDGTFGPIGAPGGTRTPDHLIRSRFVLYPIFPGSVEADRSFPDQHREGRGHRGLARHCAGAQPGQWGIFLQAGEEFPRQSRSGAVCKALDAFRADCEYALIGTLTGAWVGFYGFSTTFPTFFLASM